MVSLKSLGIAALLLLGVAGADAGPTPSQPGLAAIEARPTAFLDPGSLPAAWTLPPPNGPPLPTLQDGIGPGSGMQQLATPDSASGFLCTAAFLLRDPYTAKYYLSTAGHCLVINGTDPTPYTGAANPDKVNQEIDICVAGCIDNALGLGTYVKLIANGTYQPVAYAESGGPGLDFGIIEIPAENHGLLRPWIPQFGGPTGMDTTQSGDTLVHYGHGTYCCPSPVGGALSRTPVDQGRTGVSLGATSFFGAPTGTTFAAMGSSSGGDSGSGVALAATDSARGLRGAAALGVLTHTLTIDGVPYFEGTLLTHGLNMVRAATGLELELVLEGDPLDALPQPRPESHVAILKPAAGQTVHADPDGTTTVRGTAGTGNGTPTPGALVQLAIDDPGFGAASRVPVIGNATWSAQWDLHGVAAGRHTLHARLVGADGTILADVNQTVNLASGSPGSGPGAPSNPGGGGPNGTHAPGHDSTTTQRRLPSASLGLGLCLLALAVGLRRKPKRLD